MRVGGGGAKGAEWERQVGKLLSLWLTNDQHPDLFTRNVLSGGSFTIAESKGRSSSRMPGDLMAANPLAFDFLRAFSVECKHLADIGLEAHFWDPRGATMLGEIIKLARRQARSINCEFMVIAKQNRREPLMFVDGRLGPSFLNSRIPTRRVAVFPMYHLLHRNTIFVMRFTDVLLTTDPKILLAQIGGYDANSTNKRLASRR
jgi:hypothetical protein